MKSNAVSSARQTCDYMKYLDREVRRLRRENETLAMQLLAARTAAAHLRDELSTARHIIGASLAQAQQEAQEQW